MGDKFPYQFSNPLFVSEVTRLLGQEGLLDAGDQPRDGTWEIHIPEKVPLATRGRIRHLSALCQGTPAAAALMGREGDAPLVQGLAGEGAVRLVESLQEALGGGVDSGSLRRFGLYRFTHVMIQKEAREQLPCSRSTRSA